MQYIKYFHYTVWTGYQILIKISASLPRDHNNIFIITVCDINAKAIETVSTH